MALTVEPWMKVPGMVGIGNTRWLLNHKQEHFCPQELGSVCMCRNLFMEQTIIHSVAYADTHLIMARVNLTKQFWLEAHARFVFSLTSMQPLKCFAVQTWRMLQHAEPSCLTKNKVGPTVPKRTVACFEPLLNFSTRRVVQLALDRCS